MDRSGPARQCHDRRGALRSGTKERGRCHIWRIFNVAVNQSDYRLPELFCGFSKNYSDRPIWYPVSCSPRAWAAGSMFLMLDSMLGLKADAVNNQLTVDKPMLPPYLNNVSLSNIRVGKSSVDLRFVRTATGTKCEIIKKIGPVAVSIKMSEL